MLPLKPIDLTTKTVRSRHPDDDATTTQKDESKPLKLKITYLNLTPKKWTEWTLKGIDKEIRI